jgi:membrane protease YdiL (CAAX protease family)
MCRFVDACDASQYVSGVKGPVREALAVWAGVILGLAALELIGLAVPFVHGLAGAAAVAAFLRDLAWSLGACAIVLPLFTAGFWLFSGWVDRLPGALHALLAPYAGRSPRIHAPMTLDFAGQVAGNAAVALSEEFFYRGYLTLRFEERMRAIPAALLAAALFAVGHLLTPAPFRLAVFFPALLFAFLRNRTRTIVGAAICHFLSNVWLLVLQS